jgi:hypothetical protein
MDRSCIEALSMSESCVSKAGGYTFLPAAPQYSLGAAALPDFAIQRVRFSQALPLHQGFEEAARHLAAIDRPLSALCACELRSPEPFTERGFADFNAAYIGILKSWDVAFDQGNPIARSNVCPKISPPREPSLYAFSYTVIEPRASRSFVIAGSCEAPEGKENYRDFAIRLGDTSPSGLSDKVTWVFSEIERRLRLLSIDWDAVTGIQTYSVHDVFPALETQLVARNLFRHGITHYLNRPPIRDLEFEMDCRGIYREHVIPA